MAGHICRLDGSRIARGISEGVINGRQPVGKAKDRRRAGVTRHARNWPVPQGGQTGNLGGIGLLVVVVVVLVVVVEVVVIVVVVVVVVVVVILVLVVVRWWW